MPFMQWGGSLGLVLDAPSGTSVNLRAFGAFEGTIAHPDGEAILQPLLLEAVRVATARYTGPLLSIEKQKAAIAQAAQGQLAPRLHELGAVGTLSITAYSFAPEDHERLLELSRQAAQAAVAARMAAMAVPADPPAPAPPGASVPKGDAAPAQAPAAVASGVVAGASVLVQWSDGQRYPGIVRESRDGQHLVAFPNGGMQWIHAQFVSLT